MRISFICNHIYINDGWGPRDTRLGGSEEFIVEVSKRLQARGHQVQVFHNGQHGEYEGVLYKDHSDYEPGDVTINVNFPTFEPQGKTVFWTSLTNHPDLSSFDAVCAISQYAKDNTNLPERTILVPPGYDPSKIYPEEKIPKQCFYASSPDRGLDTLLEEWPRVHEAHPDATLILTYGANGLDLPNVLDLGNVDEDTMNEIYRTSDVWCHPANGGELYCMTGVKAQAAGCIPVVIPTMALSETVRHGYKLVDGNYGTMLIDALSDDHTELRQELLSETYPTWDDSTNKLLEVVSSVII